MSRLRSFSGRAKAALAASLLLVAAAGCDEDGKTAPERCKEPAFTLFDTSSAGVPADDNARYNDDNAVPPLPPCVTEIGHAVSPPGSTPSSGGTATAGSGGTATAGTSNGGTQAAADAGAGGA